MVNIRIAGIEKLSLVNGDGCRAVVFVQGCRHNCPGCQNPDTWDFHGGYSMEVSELASVLKTLIRQHPLDGLTLSGGDPFYQERACSALMRLLPDELDLWVYTGFRYEEIADTELAMRADVIVDGPYIEALRREGQPYGSSNQRIIRKGRTGR